jgi:hypothetical protein
MPGFGQVAFCFLGNCRLWSSETEIGMTYLGIFECRQPMPGLGQVAVCVCFGAQPGSWVSKWYPLDESNVSLLPERESS